MAIFDPTTPDEVWYPIPSCPGYQLSSDWRVRKFRDVGPRSRFGKWRPIVVGWLKIGYKYFHYYEPDRQSNIYLHHVVAELIYGSTPSGQRIRHYDDDKGNNFPSNLCFGTQSENLHDAVRNGCVKVGEARHDTKLSSEAVRDIRRRVALGIETQAEIGSDYGLDQRAVWQIKERLRWRHLD
jgi:hypothetical protein